MNLTRCLTVLLLLAAVVVGVVLLAVYLFKGRKTTEEDTTTAPSEPSASTPDKAQLEKKLEQRIEEARQLAKQYDQEQNQLRKNLFEEHASALEELDRKHRDAIQKLRQQHDLETKSLETKSLETATKMTVDLELSFDVNLPNVVGTYKVGSETVKISKEPYSPEGTVKYTHQRMAGFFNLKKVHFGLNTYEVDPPIDDVVLVTVFALEIDPRYPYYMIIGSKGRDPELYENDGKKFVPAGEVTTFRESMAAKAKEFGRPTIKPLPSEVPVPPTKRTETETPIEEAETEPETPQPQEPKAVFHLDFNRTFTLGSDDLNVKVSSEYNNKYVSYFYYVQDKVITPDCFNVNFVKQNGLPEGQPFNGVVVYVASGVLNTPLMVKFLYQGEATYYFNSLENNWTSTEEDHLEEQLDYLDSHVNNRIVLNVGRRSDYYRNGTGESKFEPSKDVNVYVETDSPCLGWTTYKHTLEVGGEGGEEQSFFVSRMVFGQHNYVLCPKKEVQYVEIYGKSDSDSNIPPNGMLVKYADGSHEYYLRYATEFLDEAVCNLDVNELNLPEKLKKAATPYQYKPSEETQTPADVQTPSEVEVVLSKTESREGDFTTIAKPDPTKFSKLFFPGYVSYVHVFKQDVKVDKYSFKGREQNGLPTDKTISGVLVYFMDKSFELIPRVVCTIPTSPQSEYQCFAKSGPSNWVELVELRELNTEDPDFTEKALGCVKKHYKLS